MTVLVEPVIPELLAGTPVSAEVERSIERFLIQEADLLDTRQFEAWNALFLPEAVYWVPGKPDQQDPYTWISLYFDDAEGRDIRIRRLRHERNFADDPPYRSLHVVQNVLAEETAVGTYEVRSRLIMFDYRNDAQRVYAGRVRHVLQREGVGFRIAFKRVDILNCDGTLPMMMVPF
jgi:benzoate/toluate 1,2-dioxygenase beta subunit